MALDLGILVNMGLPEILIWLLTFALVYGILNQAGLPKNKEIQALIAIIIGLMVILAVPKGMIAFISSMSSGLLLVVLGIIVLMVFLEIAGIKHKEKVLVGEDKEGNKQYSQKEVIFFSRYPRVIAATLLIIFLLIFAAAGGFQLLGIGLPAFSALGSTSILFIVVAILAIMWIVKA